MTILLSSWGAARALPHLGLRYAGVPSATASTADLLSRGERHVRNTNSTGLEYKGLQLRRVRNPSSR
jgi:hypothetical protein